MHQHFGGFIRENGEIDQAQGQFLARMPREFM
jgi:hypothetical protein